jgi:class 3 adenylate cyclase
MPRERATFAILFADIAQSTQLYESHGDTVAQTIIAQCVSTLNGVSLTHGGRVIKTIGDEILCVFPTARDAVEAAREMLSALESAPMPVAGGEPPNLHIGIHYGSVIVDEGDIFGDAVNIAARMVSLAKENQIVLTHETVDALPADFNDFVRCIYKTKVKGKSEQMLIYEVLCARETATLIVNPVADAAQPAHQRLELMIADRLFEVSEGYPVKTLGRQSQNDIIVNDDRVSRAHARIEFRRGKFFLVDQSTNGTYVTQRGMARVLLRRDEMVLEDSGLIALYDEVENFSTDAIHYAVKGDKPPSSHRHSN